MRILVHQLFTFSALSLFVSLASAQLTDLVGLTDFPAAIWPEDGIDSAPGVMPQELSETYVFVDLKNNEYIVVYPVALEEEEKEEEQEQQGQQARGRGRGGQQEQEEKVEVEKESTGPVPLKITHYDLLRDVEPAVTLMVSAQGPDEYRYTYTLANGPDAGQSIDQWAMVVPPAASLEGIKNPAGWFGIFQPDRNFKLKNPEWISNGAAAVWSYEKQENVVEPGGVMTGFQFDSTLRPGFTVGFFREAESTGAKVATSGYVPDVVKEQMNRLLVLEYNSKTVLTIGPKFDGQVTLDLIAADFIQGIFTLSRMGILDLASEFVRTTLNELTGVQSGSDSSSLSLTELPTSQIETEILNALKVSLQID